jgi:hypothetical protein
MEQIIIYKRNGEVRYKLNSYKRVCTVKSAEQKRELLGEDTVTVKTEGAEPLEFSVGDYITVYGDTYTLNMLNEQKKASERKFENNLVFEGVQYKLLDAQYRSADALGYNPTASFPLMANMELAMQVLINNANRISQPLGETWILGDYPDTEYKELTFNNENCLGVLQRLCGEFETEFEIETLTNKTYKLHIRKAGSLFPATFTYGKGGGIYSLRRKNVNSSSVVTKLYVEGGTKNIKTGYRNNAMRLRLAINEESYIQQDTAVAAMGIKEGSKIFEDIYPRRKGYVTALAADRFSFIDSDMFNLNEKEADGKTTKWLIDGTSAKIKFNTGNLAGYEFEISKYNTATQTFTIKEYEDSRGFKMPSTETAYQIEVGNEYVLLDIIMPNDPYIVDAEAELLEKGTKFYEQNSQPKVEYELEIASMYLRKKYESASIVNVFNTGDYLPIKDTDINVDKAIRIKGFTRDVYKDEYNYRLTISDMVDVSIIEKLISDNIEQNNIISINNLTDVAKARSNWRTTQELLNMVFDSDGYFDAGNIRPSSISTLMLAVGNRAGQFILQNVTFSANAIVANSPNPNKVQIISNGGILVHYGIEETNRTWQVASSDYYLAGNGAYYVYAKCEKSGSSCLMVGSQSQLSVDADANYYFFPVGVLSSIYNGYRELTTTYGATRITGRTINCGRIESIDKNTYFDLDNGEIGGNIKFISTGGSTKNVAELDNVAQETKDYINNTLPDIISGIQAQLDGQIEQFFEDYDPTTNNAPASKWELNDKEMHLGDLFYNTTSGRVWRWIKQSVSNPPFVEEVYFWQELQDSELAEALALANEALELAGEKRRIFTDTPYTPYDIGDLWVQGTSGDIMRCKAGRASGNYSASDWEKASKYTDDTVANQAKADAATAKAVTQNFTTIDGGLILTTLIKMLVNNTETGGISANLNNMLLWGGGTYSDALQNIAKIILRHDGSGQLLGGLFKFTSDNKLIIDLSNFKIDSNGNISITGNFKSESGGNRVEINPASNSKMIFRDDNRTRGEFRFGTETDGTSILELILTTYRDGVTVYSYYGSSRMLLFSPAGGGNAVAEINTLGTSLNVSFRGLPTSASGLTSGRLWRDGTTLKIVP